MDPLNDTGIRSLFFSSVFFPILQFVYEIFQIISVGWLQRYKDLTLSCHQRCKFNVQCSSLLGIYLKIPHFWFIAHRLKSFSKIAVEYCNIARFSID